MWVVDNSMRNPRGARTVKQTSRAHCESLLHSSGALATPPHSPQVKLSMGAHLPVKGWADACIGQSLEINISLIITKS